MYVGECGGGVVVEAAAQVEITGRRRAGGGRAVVARQAPAPAHQRGPPLGIHPDALEDRRHAS